MRLENGEMLPYVCLGRALGLDDGRLETSDAVERGAMELVYNVEDGAVVGRQLVLRRASIELLNIVNARLGGSLCGARKPWGAGRVNAGVDVEVVVLGIVASDAAHALGDTHERRRHRRGRRRRCRCWRRVRLVSVRIQLRREATAEVADEGVGARNRDVPCHGGGYVEVAKAPLEPGGENGTLFSH